MRALQCRTKLAQTGLSIVELMVALALGLLIIGGILYTFISSRPVFTANDAVARIQEDGRIAMERLAREIRQAGYMGCANSLSTEPTIIADVNPKDGSPDMTAADVNGIQVFDGGAGWSGVTTPLKDSAGKNIVHVSGTDVIQFRGLGTCQAKLTGNLDPNNATLAVPGANPCSWKQNQVLVIADCSNADVFSISNVLEGKSDTTVTYGSGVNTQSKLSKIYGREAIVFAYSEKTFFVGINPDVNQPMLYEVLNTGTPSDVAGNVYDLQVESVKIDTDGDGAANESVAPATLAYPDGWNQAVGLRVQFSVRSEADNTGPESKTYTYNGASVTDRRLRRDFVTNIGIRNRLP